MPPEKKKVMDISKLPKQSQVEEFRIGDMDIKIVENTPENFEHIMDVIRSLYEVEPCRICGEMIGDASKAVFAGYSSENESRAAHKSCWDQNIPQSQWTFPESAK